MGSRPAWWDAWQQPDTAAQVDGLLRVRDYAKEGRPPEEVAVMEKAAEYGADAVFFEAEQQGRSGVPQAFIYGAESLPDDQQFAELHRQLWSWGGVPLVYRRKLGVLQLFRCAHKPDFLAKDGSVKCRPADTLQLVSQIELSLLAQDAQDGPQPWWDEQRIRSGTLWTDPSACKFLLSDREAAHKSLFNAFKRLSMELDQGKVLPKPLRRRLLILSLLIAYLEQRNVFPKNFFAQFKQGAQHFFEVLRDGPALVELLEVLEERFNGKVFSLQPSDRDTLLSSQKLERYASMVEAREGTGGQLSLWELYSFRDLPVELISQIYQLFVANEDSSVYTPPFLVRFLVEEALSWEALDRITTLNQVVLDPCCGSGVFLVEAYKRLVLHWRMRNGWQRPDKQVLQRLLKYVHGVDLEEEAVTLAGFSLCLAMCDALLPEQIRKSIKLFPNLREETLHHGCFFATRNAGLLPNNIGAILGNPPFESKLPTSAMKDAYASYEKLFGRKIPDKQAGYLFLHAASELMADGATISMVQQYNFLYNQNAKPFRQGYLKQYWVRELLDFVSVRGMFQKGKADTKIIVVVAQKKQIPEQACLLHATFRRTGRIDAEQGLDLDYYDLHVVPYQTAIEDDRIWRANLLGGGRALSFVNRIDGSQTLRDYAKAQRWIMSEGFIVGSTVERKAAKHLTGADYLPSEALTEKGIDRGKIEKLKEKLFRSAYAEEHFTPPMLLIREHMNLDHALWTDSYLTYSQRIVGICAPKADLPKLRHVNRWIKNEKRALHAYLFLTSPGLFIQKATALQASDIYSIPYPQSDSFELTENERIVIDDIVDYQADFVRLGESSAVMNQVNDEHLEDFSMVLVRQMAGPYEDSNFGLRGQYRWSGAVCQIYAFGDAHVDWSDAAELQNRVEVLLRAPSTQHINMTRICRLYDGQFMYLLKPDRLRYWTRSVALRDADDVMADLRIQGF